MLTVNDLRLTYKDQASSRRRRNAADVGAVEGVSFTVREGEFFTLLGPSGCGKTTTLRCIAGLETPDEGEILLKGSHLYSNKERINVPAYSRGLGMVFQSYAIWPHMTVLENVCFPLRATRRRTGMSKAEIVERGANALETVGLLEFSGRLASRLSGGQQQRLALARALAPTPSMLLLDEPLSNLDANLRESMRLELKRLQQSLGLTIIYVTHDQVEALSLSTTLAVMNRGSIAQVGHPKEIYEEPTSEYVMNFVGTSTLITGHFVEARRGSYVVKCDFGEIEVADRGGKHEPGEELRMYVRPQGVLMRPAIEPRPEHPRHFTASVVTRSYSGDRVTHVVDLAGIKLVCTSEIDFTTKPGDSVYVGFTPGALRILDQ